MKTTRKKTKIIGQQTFVDHQTGELVEMNVIEAEERDCNFHKLWLGHIIQTLELIGNKKMKVVNYIMENVNGENIFIKTQQDMEKELGISRKTIVETLQALRRSDFLTKIQAGVYRINPNVIFKGGKNSRLDVLIRYRNEKEIGNEKSQN